MGRDTEDEAILRHLLVRIDTSAEVRQRDLAKELGIALGMANAYIRRGVDKGLIKVKHIPARRYAYYLTPKGFAEKSRLVAEYLSCSFQFFRDARAQCREIFSQCEYKGWHRILLFGGGDLVEIATLAAREADVNLVGVVVDPAVAHGDQSGLEVFPSLDQAPSFDAILITDFQNPQGAYDRVCGQHPEARIFTLPMCHVSRERDNSHH